MKKFKRIRTYNLKRKHLLFVCGLLFLGTIFMIKDVYAALKDTDDLVNEFKVSDFKAVIEEEFIPPSISNPAKPGAEIQKEVAIVNQSLSSVFVRVLVTPEILSADGVLLSGVIGKELHVDLNANWLLGEDGYYYYLGKLTQGEKTPPIFTKVTITDQLEERYKRSTLSILVKSEAIGTAKEHYREAWWVGGQPQGANLIIVDDTLQQMIDR